MGNRQNLSPARNQKTTTELTPNLQPSRSQSEEFTEKYLRGQFLCLFGRLNRSNNSYLRGCYKIKNYLSFNPYYF
jgi:hypothetical protein